MKKLVALSVLLGVLAVVAVRTLEAPAPDPGPEVRAEPAPGARDVEEASSDSVAPEPLTAGDRVERYQYDSLADRLSLNVRDVPLAQVLKSISERAGLTIDIVAGLSLSSPVTIEFERVPLVQAYMLRLPTM